MTTVRVIGLAALLGLGAAGCDREAGPRNSRVQPTGPGPRGDARAVDDDSALAATG